MKRIPGVFRNFFVVTGISFLIWMLFLNSTDLFAMLELRSKLSDLQDQKTYYQEKIKLVYKDREALMNNERLLEKFARENYLMKKPSEDVFIIEKEN